MYLSLSIYIYTHRVSSATCRAAPPATCRQRRIASQ